MAKNTTYVIIDITNFSVTLTKLKHVVASTVGVSRNTLTGIEERLAINQFIIIPVKEKQD